VSDILNRYTFADFFIVTQNTVLSFAHLKRCEGLLQKDHGPTCGQFHDYE
jgi:hypothetical protein